MSTDPETTKTLHPPIKWAQRLSETDAAKNVLFLTVAVVDPKNLKVDLTETSLDFSADAQDGSGVHWKFHIDFYEPIDPKESVWDTKVGSHVLFLLRKAKQEKDYWPRLTKDKLRHPSIGTDFDKWVDEDEQDEHAAEDDDMMNGIGNDMDFGLMMGGAGGAGGPGGPGGPGGIDFSQLMAGMGGAGGAGGAGGIDFEKLMASAGGAGGAGEPDLSKLAATLGQAGGEGEKEEEETK